MLRWLTALVGAIVVAFGLTMTEGHAASAFKGFENLEEEDLELLKAAAESLYANPSVEVGTAANWANPETGNNGSVTLIKKFEYEGMPCGRVLHMIKIKGESDLKQAYFDRCEVEPGVWKIK